MSANKHWKANEVALLRELYENGATWEEMTSRLDRTAHAIANQVKKRGITRRPEELERIRAEGRAAFFSDPQRRAGWIYKKRQAMTPEKRAALIQRNREGRWFAGYWQGREFSEEHRRNISEAHSRRWAEKIGIPPGHPLREEYRRIAKVYPAAEARRMIAEQIARLPQHERQIIKLQLGQARIVGV